MQRIELVLDEMAHRTALRFHDIIEQTMGKEVIHIDKVAGACTALLTTYMQGLTPTDRILVLNEIVESMLAGINTNYTSDITLN